MTDPQADMCATFADRLERQALAGGTAGAGLVLLLVFIASTGMDSHPLPGGLLLVATLAALAVLALSALLRFDAALFHAMAGKDEAEACAEIDKLLAAMRLKPAPATTRPLADRIEGTRRLVTKLRAALAIAGAATAGAALALWL